MDETRGPADSEPEETQEQQKCGPFGFWPTLALPPGVSWGDPGDPA
jgi:hypothetical protein